MLAISPVMTSWPIDRWNLHDRFWINAPPPRFSPQTNILWINPFYFYLPNYGSSLSNVVNLGPIFISIARAYLIILITLIHVSQDLCIYTLSIASSLLILSINYDYEYLLNYISKTRQLLENKLVVNTNLFV
jgi:hypothetical protein